MNKRILVGSNAFFGKLEGFKSRDMDYVELFENPKSFKWRREQSIRGVDIFQYKKLSAPEMVNKTLESKDPLTVGKFLVPEFIDAIGATINDVSKLKPLVDKLDSKHRYQAVIFKAYIDNKSFSISENQLNEAYKSYSESRNQ